MRNSSSSPSPSSCRTRSEKPHLRSSKSQCKDPVQLSSMTPEKQPQPLPQRRTRNSGVALSLSEIRKVVKGLHDGNKPHETSSSSSLSKPKTARRQIAMPSPVKPKTAVHKPFMLPEKYEILAEFFDSLDSSIRLLRLKGSMTSFTNIGRKVESLTDRRFTHGHLAQLKFILPEAIAIKKILVFDERTCCMKPDLHVIINPDAVESDVKSLPEHGTLPLRKLFRVRLEEFCKSHPEDDEIPEETLPDPFNRPRQDPLLNILKAPSSSFSMKTLSDAHAAHPPTILSASMLNSDTANQTDPANIEKDLSLPVNTSIEDLPVNTSIENHNQQPAVASHMSQAFRRRFFQKSKENVVDYVHSDTANQTDPANMEKNLSLPVNTSIEDLPVNTSIEDQNQQPAVVSHMSQAFGRRFFQKSKENIVDYVQQKLPVSESCLKKNSTFEVTKSHPKTSPIELASKTVSIKACQTIHSSSDDFISSSVAASKIIDYTENKDGSLKSTNVVSTPVKLVSTPSSLMSATPALPPAKRHYMSPEDNSIHSPNKLAKRPSRPRSLKFDTPVKKKDNVDGLSIDDDIFDILPDNLLQSIREKERIANEERDPTISQAKKRKKAIASLPKLFYMIRMLFHSKNCSVITREELISKIISNHVEIIDRSEVEEQLHLLLELVPEWISEKLASSGDLLFCLNKMSDPDTIRASLEAAK